MENYEDVSKELCIQAQNELDSTDCVTPAYFVKDSDGKEKTLFGGLGAFNWIKKQGYKIVKVFIPDI